METSASNYRAAATLQGASCTYLYPGCLASAAFNYDPTANQAGLCVPVRRGCMTQGALNFQPNPNPNPNPNHNPNHNHKHEHKHKHNHNTPNLDRLA